MKRSIKDFPFIKSTLTVVLVAILVFTALDIYHGRNKTNKALDTADKTTTSQVSSTDDTISATPKAVTSTPSTTTTNTSGVMQTTYLKLPSAFQAAYVEHAKSTGTTCVDANSDPLNESGQTYDPSASYVTDQFVRTTECSANALYAYQNGAWQFVATTQGDYVCNVLEQFKVPSALIQNGTTAATCLDSNNKEIAYQQS